MFYNRIKPFLDSSDFIRKFDRECSASSTRTSVSNLNHSARSLLLARAFHTTGKNILIISADENTAEGYVDDLDLLVGARTSRFLPVF